MSGIDIVFIKIIDHLYTKLTYFTLKLYSNFKSLLKLHKSWKNKIWKTNKKVILNKRKLVKNKPKSLFNKRYKKNKKI